MADYFGDFICFIKSYISGISITGEVTARMFQDSRSNFIFATHESCPAKELFAALRGKHIYVRYFPKDRIDNHLRITIGTDEEMKKLVEFLTEYLQK